MQQRATKEPEGAQPPNTAGGNTTRGETASRASKTSFAISCRVADCSLGDSGFPGLAASMERAQSNTVWRTASVAPGTPLRHVLGLGAQQPA